MAKRNLLVTVLILITVASLVTVVFFYNQAKSSIELPNIQSNGTPAVATTSGQENTSAGGQPSSSAGTNTVQGSISSTGGTPSSTEGGETTDPQTSSVQAPLQAQIEQKYTDRLQSVGSSYEGRLNSLVASAINEYRTAKKADPNADLSPIANKYYAQGKAIEAECDSKMYAIMDAFESELRANSFPVDTAVRARATYDATKSSRAGQILSSQP